MVSKALDKSIKIPTVHSLFSIAEEILSFVINKQERKQWSDACKNHTDYQRECYDY